MLLQEEIYLSPGEYDLKLTLKPDDSILQKADTLETKTQLTEKFKQIPAYHLRLKNRLF